MERNLKITKAKHTQGNELTHPMAHYLLSIHELKEVKGYARITDMARVLGLTKGTVSMAVSNLKKKNLVQEEEESKFLSLTPQGHQEVHGILSSRTLLFHLFQDVLGVDTQVAHQDSCLIEHLISEHTREKLFDFFRQDHSWRREEICTHPNVQDFIDSQTVM